MSRSAQTTHPSKSMREWKSEDKKDASYLGIGCDRCHNILGSTLNMYEHLAFPGVLKDIPTVWLTYVNRFEAPNYSWYKGKAGITIPTLEIKGGDWMSTDENCSAHFVWHFCHAQGYAQKLHDMSLNHVDSAPEALEDFLHFLGNRMVVELHIMPCYWERADLSYELCTPLTWLKTLEPYHQCIKHLSLDYLALSLCNKFDEPSTVNQTSDFVERCGYVHECLTNVESMILWLHLSKEQVEVALTRPNEQAWVRACKLVSVEKMEVKLRVFQDYEVRLKEPRHRGLYIWAEFWGGNLFRSHLWAPDVKNIVGFEDKESAARLKEIFMSKYQWESTNDIPENPGLENLFSDTGMVSEGSSPEAML
ncbi:uncharacterized protein LY89DRAFT_722047 [Mollisia scopiformis]|uniref:Uncharacterized protein n=1 Tax=Mollisia scopiformis TaxID=149040 RepID=A0A194WXL5_MOLSC|nr:uncharacterized protein LY89DRAFT_722047 [Mollisia scopiformis]KUJ12419.1 hypothetical protein LY89DRAFT_722047 [Mollisia scopiformis]